MRKKLAIKVFNGELIVADLNEKEQKRILKEYNELAEQWIVSADPEFQQLARDIFRVIENTSLVSESDGHMLH